MKKSDYHIHAEFSYDSSIVAFDLCNKAVALGYSEIAFTEHLDLLPQELGLFGLKSQQNYRHHLDQLTNDFPELTILKGLEIGDYHRVKSFADSLIRAFPMEIVLGSIHFLTDDTNVAIPLSKPLSEEQVIDYYQQNIDLVTFCDMHVLAHLGVYKRYYPAIPNECFALGKISEILRIIIEKEIALELNYSPIRKKYCSILPDAYTLDLYASMGGKLVTIGSDAHDLQHFNDHYHEAERVVIDYKFELLQASKLRTLNL